MNAAKLRRLMRAAVLAQVLLSGVFIAGSYNAFTRLTQPTTTDFASFYAAGKLALSGHAAGAYDLPTHRAAEEKATAPGIDYKYFLNPPPFLLICAPLASLPYLAAFILFELLSFSAWLAITTRIAGGGSLAALTLAATPAVYWALGWGQNSFLTAGLMGLGTLLLRTRPGLAGGAFGALCIKPHFGVLIPLALLCARQWRAIATATLTVAILGALSTAAFGTSIWPAFLDMALHARNTIETGKIQFSGHIDPGGAARLLGAGATTGWIVQAVCSFGTACLVAWVWWPRKRHDAGMAPGRYEARMAALVAGTLIAMPFLLFYDLVMATVAAAWLAQAARRTGWRRYEPTVLALLMTAILFAFPAAALLHLAIGCVVGPALLALAVRRLAA